MTGSPTSSARGPHAARLVASARVVFGAFMVARPDRVTELFGLEATPGTSILARGVGARDLASGWQLFTTPATAEGSRRFLQGRALIDLLEIVAFAAATRRGRRHWSGFAVPVAAAASALGQWRLARRVEA